VLSSGSVNKTKTALSDKMFFVFFEVIGIFAVFRNALTYEKFPDRVDYLRIICRFRLFLLSFNFLLYYSFGLLSQSSTLISLLIVPHLYNNI
jgi:hypothetical protein